MSITSSPVDRAETSYPWYIHFYQAHAEAAGKSMSATLKEIQDKSQKEFQAQSLFYNNLKADELNIDVNNLKLNQEMLEKISDIQYITNILNNLCNDIAASNPFLKQASSVTTATYGDTDILAKSAFLERLYKFADLIGGEYGAILSNYLKGKIYNQKPEILDANQWKQLQQLKQQLDSASAKKGVFHSNSGINTNITALFEESGFVPMVSNFLSQQHDMVQTSIQSIAGTGIGQYKRAADNKDIKPDTVLRITYDLPAYNNQPPIRKTRNVYLSIKNLARLQNVPKIAQLNYKQFINEANLQEDDATLNAISLSANRQLIADIVYFKRIQTALQGSGGKVKNADFKDTADILIEYTPKGIRAYSIASIQTAINSVLQNYYLTMKNTGFNVMATQLNRKGDKPSLDKWHDNTVEWYKNKNAIRIQYNAEKDVAIIAEKLKTILPFITT